MARKSMKPILRKGSKGAAVRALQEALGVDVDGDFGPDTDTALRRFQRDHELKEDGVAGPRVWKALEEHGGDKEEPTPEPEPDPAPQLDPYGWQTNIIASVFGGEEDNYREKSAYTGRTLDNEKFYAALPFRFPSPRPMLQVRNRESGNSIACSLEDIGPWHVNNPYWMTHTRPDAETSHRNRTALTYGPNRGRVANGAGIDLSPAAMKALGIHGGMGVVDFRLIFHPATA